MLNRADNLALCQVEGEARMGRFMRSYWIPFLRSAKLVAGGAPAEVKLLGEELVAYRAPDGKVGLTARHCPHRCASMGIARNEDGGLRCIFHGWKYDASGALIEAPTELPAHREALKKRVRLKVYPAHEAGGLIWAWMGDGEPAPFPEFEFTKLEMSQIDVKIAILPFNWLQNLESVLDSAHLGYLHSSSVLLAMTDQAKSNVKDWNGDSAPRLEFDDTPFGFREAAIRARNDGTLDVRLREVVSPFYAFLPGQPGCERALVIAVPIDDHNSMQIHVTYNPYRPFKEGEVEKIWFHTHSDHDDISDPAPGAVGWPQDRAAMAEGHFSGITNRHVFYEDFAVLQSMGPIVDRREEHLSSTDLTIVRFRKAMLAALDNVESAQPWGRPDDGSAFASIRTQVLSLPADEKETWREIAASGQEGAAQTA